MKPVYAASLAAAFLLHALVLFGFKMETAARPLALSDEPSSVDVSLVESAPATEPSPQPASTPEPTATPEPMATPEPSATPEPTATPEPMETPVPTPDMSTPPPEPEQTPVPDAMPASSPVPTSPPSTPRPHSRTAHPTVTHPHNNTQSTAIASQQGPSHPGAVGAASGPAGTAVRYRSNPRPEYPQEARRAGQEGVVLLSVEVGTDGRADSVSLKRGSGYPLLDEAAIRAVRGWTFEPKTVASLPVASTVDVPIRFNLSE